MKCRPNSILLLTQSRVSKFESLDHLDPTRPDPRILLNFLTRSDPRIVQPCIVVVAVVLFAWKQPNHLQISINRKKNNLQYYLPNSIPNPDYSVELGACLQIRLCCPWTSTVASHLQYEPRRCCSRDAGRLPPRIKQYQKPFPSVRGRCCHECSHLYWVRNGRLDHCPRCQDTRSSCPRRTACDEADQNAGGEPKAVCQVVR